MEMKSATTTGTKPARVTKRRAETRARLLDAAFQVIADKGFGHVRIEDVCTAAGYTRGAFYSQVASAVDGLIARSGVRLSVPQYVADLQAIPVGRLTIDRDLLSQELEPFLVRQPLSNELSARPPCVHASDTLR